jgi:tryptophan 2,3-dioxygenase
LKYEHRHGKEYYTAQLREEQVGIIKRAESNQSLLQLLNSWLERMPFFNEDGNWTNFVASPSSMELSPDLYQHPFWTEYRHRYQGSLAEVEKGNLEAFDNMFLRKSSPGERLLSERASRAALFIMLYRGYPMLQLPFQLLNALLEIDEQLSSWRYRHMNMVHRMIGTRIGTGGSSGKDYLKAAADKHFIFREIAQLNSFLIERRKLPVLSHEMERRLGFVS